MRKFTPKEKLTNVIEFIAFRIADICENADQNSDEFCNKYRNAIEEHKKELLKRVEVYIGKTK